MWPFLIMWGSLIILGFGLKDYRRCR